MKIIYVAFTVIAFIAVIIVSSSCEPEIGFGGQGTIYGNVKIPDTVSNTNKALPNAEVFLIFNSKNLAEYNFRKKTDINGYYSFPYLRRDKDYLRTDKESKYYYILAVYDVVRMGKKTTYMAIDSVEVDIEAWDDGKVLKDLTLTKSTETGDKVLSGRIYYNNLLKGGVETTTNATVEVVSEGINPTFSQTLQTDASGFFYLDNLFPQKYYLTYQFNKDNLRYTGMDTVDLALPGTDENDTLSFNEEGFLLLTVIDENRTPQAKFPVCFYSNSKVFKNSKSCKNSFYADTTNNYGRILVRELAVGGLYFFGGVDSVGNTALVVSDSVRITSKRLTVKASAVN